MKKIKFSFHDLLNNNKVLAVISVIIAFAIWVTVTPQRSFTINCPVILSTENSSVEKLGLEITSGKERNISVTVEGEWYNISKLSSEDISISYSFGGITDPGEYEIQVVATKTNATADFTITNVTPDKVKVSMDHMSTVEFPIDVVIKNIKADDGFILGKPSVVNNQDTIKITGPATKLEKLTQVVAEVDSDETLTKSKEYKSELKFLNKKGKEIDISEFTMPYTEVDVLVPVNQSKTVNVVAQFANAPEAYETATISHTLSHKTLELEGTKEALNKIDVLLLDPIDFKEISPENSTFKIKLNLPTGVTSTNGVTEIEVKIDMSGYSSKTLNVSDFKIKNQKGSASAETAYKSVAVVGPKSVISQITGNDIFIECDMSNNNAAKGSVTVAGIVKSNKYKNIWGIGDCEIRIKVK